MAKRG